MKLIGTGSALPRRVVTNDDIAQFLDADDAWIVSRTGIRSRHVISDELLEDLAAQAAQNALDMAGLTAADIDFFICSNIVNEYITPGLSSIVASRIGLRCPMIDINCACPGFLYAMDIAESYFQAGKVRNVLILCAEEPTRMASWQDRSTCVLFGDGAGAAVFTRGDKLKAVKLSADPDPDMIYEYRRLLPTPFLTKEDKEETPLMMKGRDVFKFAITTSCRDIRELLDRCGLSLDRADWFLIHQANLRITEAIRGELGLAAEKFPTNIRDHGNSSSASCPILLDECNRRGLFKPGDILVFSAFGAGLLSAAAVLEW